MSSRIQQLRRRVEDLERGLAKNPQAPLPERSDLWERWHDERHAEQRLQNNVDNALAILHAAPSVDGDGDRVGRAILALNGQGEQRVATAEDCRIHPNPYLAGTERG